MEHLNSLLFDFQTLAGALKSNVAQRRADSNASPQFGKRNTSFLAKLGATGTLSFMVPKNLRNGGKLHVGAKSFQMAPKAEVRVTLPASIPTVPQKPRMSDGTSTAQVDNAPTKCLGRLAAGVNTKKAKVCTFSHNVSPTPKVVVSRNEDSVFQASQAVRIPKT